MRVFFHLSSHIVTNSTSYQNFQFDWFRGIIFLLSQLALYSYSSQNLDFCSSLHFEGYDCDTLLK